MLKELLISEVRVNLIKFFVKKRDEEFHVRALVRELGVEINAIRRELDKLSNLNLLIKRPWGNKIFYKINKNSTYFYDLVTLVYKEDGLPNKILKVQDNLGDVTYLALSLEYCMGRAANSLELDLLIVGNPNQTFIDNLISSYERENREINYAVLSDDDFKNRKRKVDSFVLKFLIQPKMMLIGDQIEFSRIS